MEKYMLETAINAAQNGIIVIDQEARVTFINDIACELIGTSRELALKKKIKELIPKTDFDQVVIQGKPQLHKQVHLKDRVIISNRAPIKQNGKIIGAVAIFQDTTELKEAMKELTTTRELLGKLEMGLEHLSEGIIMIDQNGCITKITDSYCNFLGINKEESIGKHVAEVIKNTRMHKVLESGKAEIGEVQRINNKDVVVMRIPIKVNNEVVGAIGQVMFQDVSDLAKLALNLNLVEKKLEYYQREYKRWQRSRYTINNIIGRSPEIGKLKEMIRKVAQYHSTVLIRGESGTGKELIAHAIHEAGPRKDYPFVRVNCAAIPKELLEAELFGYEEGSFTGAKKKGKPGKFEMAEGGTIFLDEIGDMPQEMQVKLLRVLQEKEIDRIGGTGVTPINTRVIASTNRNLEKMISEKTFRYDLFYRLNVVPLLLPSLREIKEDIPIISSYIINQLNDEFGTRIEGMSPEVNQLFMNYHWPGNVRELKNVLERAINVMESTIIKIKDLPLYIQEYEGQTGRTSPGLNLLNEEVDAAEEKAIKNALKNTNYNKLKAAKMLNIHRATLYRKMHKYGIHM